MTTLETKPMALLFSPLSSTWMWARWGSWDGVCTVAVPSGKGMVRGPYSP